MPRPSTHEPHHHRAGFHGAGRVEGWVDKLTIGLVTASGHVTW